MGIDGKTGAAFNIPLGVGLKFKLSQRWNIGFEFLMKKTFSDRLDGEQLKRPLWHKKFVHEEYRLVFYSRSLRLVTSLASVAQCAL